MSTVSEPWFPSLTHRWKFSVKDDWMRERIYMSVRVTVVVRATGPGQYTARRPSPRAAIVSSGDATNIEPNYDSVYGNDLKCAVRLTPRRRGKAPSKFGEMLAEMESMFAKYPVDQMPDLSHLWPKFRDVFNGCVQASALRRLDRIRAVQEKRK